jgi:hypothetical protein
MVPVISVSLQIRTASVLLDTGPGGVAWRCKLRAHSYIVGAPTDLFAFPK